MDFCPPCVMLFQTVPWSCHWMLTGMLACSALSPGGFRVKGRAGHVYPRLGEPPQAAQPAGAGKPGVSAHDPAPRASV